MKLYLDTCVLHRPFDDQTQPRVALETEAVFEILALCDAGMASLVSSDALLFEVEAGADSERRRFAVEVLATASLVVALNESISVRARELEQAGLKSMDALHLAFAEAANVNYFCTCDDRLSKKAKAIPNLRVKVASPMETARIIVP